VFMNFVLAWVLITVAMTVGMKPFLVTESDLEKAQQTGLIEMQEVLYIHEVVEGSPAGETDLLPGDLIVEIDGQTVPEAAALPEFLSPSQAVTLTILREDRKGQILLVTDEEGKLGLSLSDAPYILFKKDLRYPVYQAPFEAIKEVGRLSWLTLDMLGKVVTSVISKFAVPEGVAGPVGIARLTHHFTQQGVIALMQFMALLSISLGVINIMPFPALDGGRFLFIIFEIILRRRPNAKWEAAIHAVGFALLMLLILLITWNDVLSFF
jgi:regulator of sigma E protease